MYEIEDRIDNNSSDGEVTAKVKQNINGLAKMKKGRKKREVSEDLLEIGDDLEKKLMDVEAKAKLNLNDAVIHRMVEGSDLKKKKKRKKMYSDGEACSTKMSISSQPLQNCNSFIEQPSGSLRMDDINRKKRNERKRKCKERKGSVDSDHSIRILLSSSEDDFAKDGANETVNLFSPELGKSKEKKKNTRSKFGDISDKGKPTVKVTAVKYDTVDAVEVSKKKKKKQSKLSGLNGKKIYPKEKSEEINSKEDLQDESSNLDETLTEENDNNLSAIIEKNARQETVLVFDEKKKDVDENITVSIKRKIPKRRSSGRMHESNPSPYLESNHSFSESENEASPNGTKALLLCQTTMQSPSVKASGKKTDYFACSECNRVYNRKDNLITHIRIKHESSPMFKCFTCSKIFQYKHVLREHIQHTHGEVDLLSCKLCSYKTKRKQDLERHVLAMHEQLVFLCPECGNEFQNEPNLRRHMKITHLNQKDFVCAVCGKSFSQAHNLKLHMKTHSENTATCIICEQEFQNRQKLSMHLLGHAPKVGFNCPHCDYVLVSESNNRMRRHIREKHSVHEASLYDK